MKKDFVVTRVSREDIAHHFGNYDWSTDLPKKYAKITDKEMKAIAAEMLDVICEADVWTALDVACVKVLKYESKL